MTELDQVKARLAALEATNEELVHSLEITQSAVGVAMKQLREAGVASVAVTQMFDAMSVADVLVRSAGFPPPDDDAAPSAAVTLPKPPTAPAGATTQENLMPKIKANAVARQVSQSYENEVGVAVRDVAREAARQWGHEHAAKFTDSPEQFGKKVAEVYLAVAIDLSEGFESDPESLGATA